MNQKIDVKTLGTVTKIQRFSIHDGPGIRTTVFFKGCSLRCFWCHNPETLRRAIEVEFSPSHCIGCRACVKACANGAHNFIDGRHVFSRDKCQTCGACVDQCFTGALELNGSVMEVDAVMQEVQADSAFYETSTGGITLSGGEPVLQKEFAQVILQECKNRDIHTAVETAGHYPWHMVADLLPLIDYLMMDIKHMDPEVHKMATGAENALILENVVRFAREFAVAGKPILFRVPVIPTINDTHEAIGRITAFVKDLIDSNQDIEAKADASNSITNPPNFTLELLPFHKLAGDKYCHLDLNYRARDLEAPSKAKMEELSGVVARAGILCKK